MDTTAMDALKAYGQSADMMKTSKPSGAGGSEGGVDFANMVTDALGDVRASAAELETRSAQTLTGESDIVDVVTAASNAEMMVQTVVTVRDKVIEAYKEVIKMPI